MSQAKPNPSRPSTFRPLALSILTLAALNVLADGNGEMNPMQQDDAETISVNGKRTATPASKQAVTQASIDATSPQSQISADYIQNQLLPDADYGTLIRITPSYSSSSPNGAGLTEAKDQTLRGFSDGQFNVTYDGIPFGDTNDFTHHTTSYFPAATIGSVLIDRSPGQADTIGYATFGGTVKLFSPKLDAKSNVRVFGDYGSHDTSISGITAGTGIIPEWSNSNILVNIERVHSQGDLTYSGLYNQNFFIKDQTAIGDSTTLTAVYSVNQIHFNNPAGTTLYQAQQLGYNYGLSNDPTNAGYWGYNYQDKRTDFGYLDISHDFGSGWSVDDKAYTYYYYNLSHELLGDETLSSVQNSLPSGVKPAAGQSLTDIAGALKVNAYRTNGNTLTVDHAGTTGELKFGLWLEHTNNVRNRYAYDFNTYTPLTENKTYGNTFYNMQDYVDNVQWFGEYAWNATDKLVVTPGLRYQDFTRRLNAQINQNNLPGTNGLVSKSWKTFLPSLDANYKLESNWSVYAQAARGVLAPNLNTLYSNNPLGNDNVNPQDSIAYQMGTVFKGQTYTFDVDTYLIDFSNYIASQKLPTGTIYFNAGGVRYTGLEMEGNALVGAGFSVYGNATLNRAVFTQDGNASAGQTWTSGQSISYVPKYTGALSLNYDNAGWHGALATKFVGSMYQGKNGAADGSLYHVGAFHISSLTLAKDIDAPTHFLKSLRISGGIDNLFNTHAITDNLSVSAAATTAAQKSDPGNFLYYFVPARTYNIGLRADF